MVALAIVFLVAASIVFVIDVAMQFDMHWAIRLKWSLLWYAARYIGIVSATLISLDVVIRGC